MIYTTTETYTVNGVVLNTLAFNISSISGRLKTPSRRGSNITVPNRHGTIRAGNKRFDQGHITLTMWVIGTNEDGTIPTNTSKRRQFFDNVDKLLELFTRDTASVVHTRSDGSQRQVTGEITETIDLAASHDLATFAVEIGVPNAFWEDVGEDIEATFSGTGVWGITEFIGATAPMDDLTVRFSGTPNNPRITQGDVWLQYSKVFTTGQQMSLNCDTWNLVGGGGMIPDYTAVLHAGDPRWFVLKPGAFGIAPQVTVTQTGTNPMTTTLIGKRKYLTE